MPVQYLKILLVLKTFNFSPILPVDAIKRKGAITVNVIYLI